MEKNTKALDFELKIFRHFRFWKMFASEESRFSSLYSVKTTDFAFFVRFQKAWVGIENIIKYQFLNEKNTTRHILK